MPDADFTAALVAWGRLSPFNVTRMTNDFAALYAKIQLGEGKQLVSVSVPGNSASWSTSLTVQENFSALSRALAILNNTSTVWRRTVNRNFS